MNCLIIEILSFTLLLIFVLTIVLLRDYKNIKNILSCTYYSNTGYNITFYNNTVYNTTEWKLCT